MTEKNGAVAGGVNATPHDPNPSGTQNITKEQIGDSSQDPQAFHVPAHCFPPGGS